MSVPLALLALDCPHEHATTDGDRAAVARSAVCAECGVPVRWSDVLGCWVEWHMASSVPTNK